MKLKVIRYDEDYLCHICEDESENRHRVDLTSDGSLPCEIDGQDVEIYLVGKTVSVNRLNPYIEIAMEVEVL
jgi:transcription elongation factor Elf1